MTKLPFAVSELIRLVLTILALGIAGAQAIAEETFEVLQIGTQTYKNVTVTTKAKSYIFLLHSMGMSTVKVAELPKDLRLKLGYAEQDSAAKKQGAAGVWAKKTLAKLEVPQVQNLRQELKTWSPASITPTLASFSTSYLLTAAGMVLALYLFTCYCGLLICQKVGMAPGMLVWVPVMQLLPMLRAAGMSPWWFLALFIPGINLVAGAIWSFKISEARRKTPLTAILLLLPITSFLAFVYLAFSEGGSREKKGPRIEIMTLETA